jgi:hypothetical protein
VLLCDIVRGYQVQMLFLYFFTGISYQVLALCGKADLDEIAFYFSQNIRVLTSSRLNRHFLS